MIVYGFADSINWAMNTLTGDNYRVLNHTGYWVPQRNAVQSPVSGASGAFDFYKSNNFPNQPVTVQSNGLLFHTSQSNAYSAARALIDAFGSNTRYTNDRSRLWFVQPEYYKQHIPPIKGQVLYNVSGAVYRAANPTRARVYAINAAGEYIAWGATDINGNYVIAVPAGTYTMTAEEWVDWYVYGDYYPYASYYTGAAPPTPVAALTVGVNIDITPGSTTYPYRWGWAKCLSARVVPIPSAVNWAPIETEFALSEGILYSTISGSTRDEGDATTFSVTYTGTAAAPMMIHLRANANPITKLVFTNSTTGASFTWEGTLAASKELVVNSATYSVTNDGVDAYTELTSTNRLPWMSIGPRSTNSFTYTITQTTANNYDLSYRFVTAFGL